MTEAQAQGVALTVWGGGERWADDYPLKLTPDGGYGNPDQTQMGVLDDYAA